MNKGLGAKPPSPAQELDVVHGLETDSLVCMYGHLPSATSSQKYHLLPQLG